MASNYPIFNNKYEIIKHLGDGETAKVYLARSLQSGEKVAIKMIKDEFLYRDNDNALSVLREMTILKNMNHEGIIKTKEFGWDGKIVKPSGRVLDELTYITMEYVDGGLFFDFVQSMGAMGEDAGRFFLHQLLNSLEYMHNKGIVHRDLKLENILYDEELNLKICDFGFSEHKNIDKLRDYVGTKTYMAPEIKQGKTYKGTEIDIFSVGVVLFAIVHGTFPFMEATQTDKFYNMLLTGNFDKYFQKLRGNDISYDFKDLILSFFSYRGEYRPTIEEIRAHPWMKSESFDFEETRARLLLTLDAKQTTHLKVPVMNVASAKSTSTQASTPSVSPVASTEKSSRSGSVASSGRAPHKA